ncbi:acetyl-CoA carboxylase biotin carboxyl carrier protein [Kiritimatiella glycovorans]|uniref:Biotin carboxyl carrier protein of acetyl-CoA carboxylase n=1 Tax=Kiritimatiella glycovorans TaxID=1307763 RepID=A0A0G3ECP7_9BACT|nr:acetyl-CoA carboxylase biotin carboxyl carrier protein [Kiritimatiella glycovorans]AKJ64078.1 Biotin carboxyl carrier protein of acetyl-CoA carboxylase [Kiritimatiella glycovorans]
MQFREIKKIVELMKDHDLSEFELEQEGERLSISRGSGYQPQMMHAPVASAPPPAPPPMPSAEGGEPDGDRQDEGLAEITSPIVGTFYRSPSPDAESYVTVGDEVAEDSVVCIVEAMKVMNEIKAEVRGKIRKVLVDDASPVQYGQPLFLVESA